MGSTFEAPRRRRVVSGSLLALLVVGLLGLTGGSESVAAEPGLTDTTTADFQAGTLGADLYVGEDGDGELLLAPAVGSELGGSALPAGWTSDSWNAGTGSVTVGGGSLSIDGAWAGTNSFFAAGRSLAFSATFGAASFEHAGLGVDYNTSPNWAMFSTKNTATTLYARTNNGGQATETELSGVSLGQPHRFQIAWGTGEVVYFVDGQEVARHNATITVQMRPLVSEFTSGGAALTIEWLRMSPYPATGTFLSRVFDASQQVGWQSLTWQAQLPLGTTLAMSVRTGDTASPDGSWSTWTPIASSGGQIGLVGRYAQYRALLSSSGGEHTPLVEQVAFTTGQVSENQPPTATADSYTTQQDTPLTVAAPGVLSNDSDPDVGDSLTAVESTDPQDGSVTVNANGSFTYTPAPGFAGSDSFTYKASDGTAQSNAATVSITVQADTHVRSDRYHHRRLPGGHARRRPVRRRGRRRRALAGAGRRQRVRRLGAAGRLVGDGMERRRRRDGGRRVAFGGRGAREYRCAVRPGSVARVR